jgi:hypothetical protein
MVNITQYRWRASNGPMCWNVYLETAIKAYSGRPYTKVSAMHMDWHDLCHYNLKKYSSLSMPLTGAFCCHQYAFHIYVWSLRIFPTHVKEVRDKYELEAFPSDWPGAWSVPPVNERVGVLCLWHQFRQGVNCEHSVFTWVSVVVEVLGRHQHTSLAVYVNAAYTRKTNLSLCMHFLRSECCFIANGHDF